MKRLLNRCLPVLVVLMAAVPSAGFSATAWDSVLREGDIVFTGSPAGQGAAISAATGSPLTHCGVVFRRDGALMVLEAVQPVRAVALETFMRSGTPERFTVRRLKRMPDPAVIDRARAWATAQIGRNYDSGFEWGDERLYCSELVWKVFAKAGIELCPLRKAGDYNLSHPAVRRLIESRYGSVDRLPKDSRIIAPSDLAASPLVEEVGKPALPGEPG